MGFNEILSEMLEDSEKVFVVISMVKVCFCINSISLL